MLDVRSCRAAVAAFILVLCGCAPGSVDAPPMQDGVYVAKGICFGEGECFHNWRASTPVPVHAAVNPASPVIATVQPGEWVEAIDGELRFVPRRGVVRTATKVPPMSVGDVVYMLEPLGEGDYVLWHKGERPPHDWSDGSADDPITWDEQRPTPAAAVTGWWVKVKLGDGKTGWVQEPSFECMGPLQGSGGCRN